MDRSYGENNNIPARCDSFFPLGGADEVIGLSNLLTTQGVPQGWATSQNVMGFSHFVGTEPTMPNGGTSSRVAGYPKEPRTSREPTYQVRPKKVAVRSRNFSEKEDLLLVAAWVNVGHDPIHGTNQSNSTYWGRITQFFHENSKGLISDRNQKSLTSHWGTIQEQVSKFCGCLAQVEGRNQSGTTETDKLENARLMFEETEQKKFQFIHCYHALKDKSKWMNVMSSKKFNKKASSSHHGEDLYVDVEDDSTNMGHNEKDRPEGTKAAKRRNRSSSSSTWNESSLKETADSMNAQFVEAETRRQHLMELHQEKHAAYVSKRHEELLAARREKLAMVREIEEKKLQHKERMKAMEIERTVEMKSKEFEQTEKLKAMEIELKDKHFRIELEKRELNMIMQLDFSKLDDVQKNYYERRRLKLLAKAEEEE